MDLCFPAHVFDFGWKLLYNDFITAPLMSIEVITVLGRGTWVWVIGVSHALIYYIRFGHALPLIRLDINLIQVHGVLKQLLTLRHVLNQHRWPSSVENTCTQAIISISIRCHKVLRNLYHNSYIKSCWETALRKSLKKFLSLHNLINVDRCTHFLVTLPYDQRNPITLFFSIQIVFYQYPMFTFVFF